MRRRQNDAETTSVYSEQDLQSLADHQATRAGIIRPETGNLHLRSGLEESGEGRQANAPKVMVIIVTLALIFIVIITYFVSQMPKKD